MKAKLCLSVIAIMIVIGGMTSIASAYVIESFSPSEYLGGSADQLRAMEQNLGIRGAVIEDFADPTLVPGLSLSGPPYGGNTFPNSWGSESSSSFIAYPDSTVPAYINIAPGVKMMGIGIGYMEFYGYSSSGLYSTMTINNDFTIAFTPENFPLFNFGVIERNGYIKITAEIDDPLITSIKFLTLGSMYPGDAYNFDYIALMPPGHHVPEPATMLLFGSGLAGLGIMRKRFKG